MNTQSPIAQRAERLDTPEGIAGLQPGRSIDVHARENNPDSQSFLNENRTHLSAKCSEVLELLQHGIRLTVAMAVVEYGIASLPRRIADLRNSGIKISDEWVRDAEGRRTHKEYFLPVFNGTSGQAESLTGNGVLLARNVEEDSRGKGSYPLCYKLNG